MPSKIIDGVSFESNGFASICRIDNFSDELKSEIKNRLSSVCHGPEAVDSKRIFASYKNTLKEFVKRYSTKTEKIKKGMIGELLTHILIFKINSEFEPANPFFNMEEGSIKKGFDIIIFDKKQNQMWISEVKSGNAAAKPADSFNKTLLNTAKNDLKVRLSNNETNLWHNAINGAKIALLDGKAKDQINLILEKCYQETVDHQQDGSSKNVILISVTYKKTDDPISIKAVKEKGQSIIDESIFNNVIVFSIQKETYHHVAKYLSEEANV